jgi:cycloeucalenol cycloisomerase
VARWLSPDPHKAWAELYFLAYSPVWMAAVGLVMLTGWIMAWDDASYILFGIGVAAPLVVGPWILHRRHGRDTPILDSYWVKLNVWIAIVVVFGTYFGTHYFFDLMGMRYAFPVTWTWSSEVVGRAPGSVPTFMYPLTQAYFVTYFVGLSVLWRYTRTRWRLGPLGSALVLLPISYAVAFGETFFMANDALAALFSYADRTRMLAFGSIGYMIYFVIGLPMFFRIHERQGEAWPMHRVVVEALATCMLILCGLEVWAKLVGPL